MSLDACRLLSDTGCCFVGRAAVVEIEGAGPAVFARGEALASAAHVILLGARIGGQGGPDHDLARPKLVEPLPMSCDEQPYTVTYRGGSAAWIVLKLGRAPAQCATSTSFRGVLAEAPGCATTACPVVWLAPTATVKIETAGLAHAELTGAFPLDIERGRVARVQLEGAHGTLRCRSDAGLFDRPVAGETCSGPVDPDRALVLDPLRLEQGGLDIALLESSGGLTCTLPAPVTPPASSPPPPPAYTKAELLGAAGGVLVAAVAFWLVRRWRTPRAKPMLIASSSPSSSSPSSSTPPPTMTNTRLDDLRDAYASGNLVVYAGAGISAAAGLPTWPRLAADLLARLRADNAPADALAEIDDLLRRGRLVDGLSAVKHALGTQEFDLAVERACNDKGRDVPEVAQAIAALAPKLRAVLTTNLDRFLERAFAGTWDALTRPPGDLASRRGYILKFHGTLVDRSTWVFSRDQYDRAVFASPATRSTLEALFRTCPLLFVGCGLADDDLDQTFAAVRALSGDQPPVHFALVAAGSVAPFRRKTLEAAGLRLVEYDNADGKHAELSRLLLRIAGGPAGAAPPSPPVEKPTGVPPAPPVPAPATGPLLDEATIHALKAAAVAAGLVRSRGALLAGIDAGFVADLPDASSPSAQLLLDLNELNRVRSLADGTVPLATWLANALSLVGPRTEAAVFRRALDEIRAPSASR